MKYVVITSYKDVMFNLPLKELLRLGEGSMAHVKQQQQAGKIQEAYFLPGWNRFIAISEADSIEELYKNMNENPMYGLMNAEIYEAMDPYEATQVSLDAVKKAIAASK
jgi:muconolactone delta-isomerase